MTVNTHQWNRFHRLIVLIFISTVFASGCASKNTGDTVFQKSTVDSLERGDFEGDITVSEIKKLGDLGLGTFNGIDGEMIIENGVVYDAGYDGSLSIAENSRKSPFVVVTRFEPDYNLEISNKTCKEMEDSLKNRFGDLKHIRALRITADFESIKYRSVKKQVKPYPVLAEVISGENVMTETPSSGTAVGFWFPEDLKHINVKGFHFHYINKNKSRGGHLLDCKIKSAVVYIENKDNLFISLN